MPWHIGAFFAKPGCSSLTREQPAGAIWWGRPLRPFQYYSVMQGLHGPGILVHDGSKLCHLFCRHLHGSFHDKPGNAFTARRCGQRPVVVIIRGLTWEEILRIDAHVLYYFLLIDVGRK